MGSKAQEIVAHIGQTREALGANLDELERKVKAAKDWRRHFRNRPMTLLGIAFGGGVLLSAVFGGRSYRREKRRLADASAGSDPGAESTRREEVVARQTWDNVKGAIIAVATTRLLNFAGEVFLGCDRKSGQIEKTSRVISPR